MHQQPSSEVTVKVVIYPSQSIKETITQVQEGMSLHASCSKQKVWALLFNGQVLFTNFGYQYSHIDKKMQQLMLEFSVKDEDTILFEKPIEVRLYGLSVEGMCLKKCT